MFSLIEIKTFWNYYKGVRFLSRIGKTIKSYLPYLKIYFKKIEFDLEINVSNYVKYEKNAFKIFIDLIKQDASITPIEIETDNKNIIIFKSDKNQFSFKVEIFEEDDNELLFKIKNFNTTLVFRKDSRFYYLMNTIDKIENIISTNFTLNDRKMYANLKILNLKNSNKSKIDFYEEEFKTNITINQNKITIHNLEDKRYKELMIILFVKWFQSHNLPK